MNNQLPTVLLPLACFPNIEYFSWLMHAPEATIEKNETYPKQTCRNRYCIAAATGPLTLTVPVIKPNGNRTQVSGVLTEQNKNWQRTHWRAIESAYNKSPFFLYYRDDFEAIFNNPPELLMNFNLKIINLCLRLLKIKPAYKLSETFIKCPEDTLDLRHKIMPKQQVEKLFSITNFAPYIQVFADRQEFTPNLSILDLIFNLGPASVDYLQKHPPVNQQKKI